MEKRKMHGQISRKDENVTGSDEIYWCVKQRNVKGETDSPVACVKDAGIVTEYSKVTGKWMRKIQGVPTNQLTVFQYACYWPRPFFRLCIQWKETSERVVTTQNIAVLLIPEAPGLSLGLASIEICSVFVHSHRHLLRTNPGPRPKLTWTWHIFKVPVRTAH
jgi:hypothetical protein